MEVFSATSIRRAPAGFVPGFLAGVIVIVVLTTTRLEPHFVHMCGYAVGIAVTAIISLSRSGAFGREAALAKCSVVSISYALSLFTLSLPMLLMGNLQSEIFGQCLSAIVFFAVFVTLEKRFSAVESAGTSLVVSLSPKLRRMLLAATSIVILTGAALGVIAFERSVDARVSAVVSHRVTGWLNVAECYAKTKKILTVCSDTNQIIPVESAGVEDDRGHALLLSLANHLFGAPIEKRTLVWINFLITVLGFGLLALQLYRSGYRFAAGLLVASGPVIANWPVVTSDAPGAYLGLFGFALIMPIQLLRMLRRQSVMASDWVWFLVASAALVLASLVREPFGHMGVVVAIVTLALGVVIRNRSNAFWPVIVVAALVSFYVANQSTRIFVEYRALVQGVPESEGALTHGIAHNLYLGLGAEPNSFGLQYDDDFGIAAVKRADPTAVYGTKKYNDAILALYFKLVLEHPLEVASIYATKIGKAFGIIVGPVLLLILGFLTAAISLSSQSEIKFRPLPPLMIATPIVLLVILNTLQGVLTTASGNNFASITGFAALAAMAVDIWIGLLVRGPGTSQFAGRNSSDS